MLTREMGKVKQDRLLLRTMEGGGPALALFEVSSLCENAGKRKEGGERKGLEGMEEGDKGGFRRLDVM